MISQEEATARGSQTITSSMNLDQLIDYARKFLPEQQPIDVFIHHNTLHHFENQPFTEATEFVAKVLNRQPYWSHAKYLQRYDEGAIKSSLVHETLVEVMKAGRFNPTDLVFQDVTRQDLWRILLEVDPPTLTTSELNWIEQNDHEFTRLLRRLRRSQGSYHEKNLWQSLKDRLNNLTVSIDESIEDQNAHGKRLRFEGDLITFLASFFDLGVASWNMPYRHFGLFYAGIFSLCSIDQSEKILRNWPIQKKDLELSQLRAVITSSLAQLNLKEEEQNAFLLQELFSLSGWAGLISYFERSKGQQTYETSLLAYLALRLTLHVLENNLNVQGFQNQSSVPNSSRTSEISLNQVYFQVFQVMTSLGYSLEQFQQIPDLEILKLISEIKQFDSIKRRRVWQEAYEASYRHDLIKKIAANSLTKVKETIPRFQAILCIDDREESIRRHLESVDPNVQTFGTAGFFGIDMIYQDQNGNRVSLCPGGMQPENVVSEILKNDSLKRSNSEPLRRQSKNLMISLRRFFYFHSRRLSIGTFLSSLSGFIAIFPLFFRVLWPLQSFRLVQRIHRKVLRQTETDLVIESDSNSLGSMSLIDKGQTPRFQLSELADRIRDTLKQIGLTNSFAPFVIVIGHGSTSTNNPHASAYNCGACGGRRGGPNARVFARMANDIRVRKQLEFMGIKIPKSTIFIGAYHDTCSDDVDFFDVELLPNDRREEFKKIRDIFFQARMRNAQERCKRFNHAPQADQLASLLHVAGRACDLREARPEYGHSTHASCIIGPRHVTRGLDLDRRSFLVSYDPEVDQGGGILASLLKAVIGVCAGINLEYYFSCIDNEGYGCGTKLPHNIVGLVGVMNGFQSDLRTGLNQQMIEIHDPLRLQVLIYAPLKRMQAILPTLDYMNRLVKNRWIHIGIIEPESRLFYFYRGDGFELYQSEDHASYQYSSRISHKVEKNKYISIAKTVGLNH